MGRAGREVAESKFDLKRNVEKVVGSYGIEVPAKAAPVRERFAAVL
jgi:hypothetical protein